MRPGFQIGTKAFLLEGQKLKMLDYRYLFCFPDYSGLQLGSGAPRLVLEMISGKNIYSRLDIGHCLVWIRLASWVLSSYAALSYML